MGFRTRAPTFEVVIESTVTRNLQLRTGPQRGTLVRIDSRMRSLFPRKSSGMLGSVAAATVTRAMSEGETGSPAQDYDLGELD
ncbi:hypothetical protein FALCPG4_004395 [Fusarium falciforme]